MRLLRCGAINVIPLRASLASSGSRKLDDVDLVATFIEGIEFAGHAVPIVRDHEGFTRLFARRRRARRRASRVGRCDRRATPNRGWGPQLLDLVTSAGWTARKAAGTTAVVLRSDLLAVPPKDGLRRRKRRDLGQKLSAKWLCLPGEQSSLGIGEAKTLGPEPNAQDAVLGAQVLDRFTLPWRPRPTPEPMRSSST